MTKPRTPEEIAERLYSRLLGPRLLGVGASEALDMILAALREAADAAHEAGLKLGTTLQAEAIEQALREEREALRKHWLIPDRLCLSCTEHVAEWLDARSRPEEPKPE